MVRQRVMWQLNLPTNIYKSSNNKRYQQKPTSTALYWPRTTKYQLGTAYTDPVPPSTDQYRPILTQYHQVPNSIALYWPRTIKYQLVSAHVDPYLKTIFGDLEWFGDVLGVVWGSGNFWQHTAMHQCSKFLHIAHSGTLPFSILDDFLEKFQKEGGGHFRSKNFSCRFKHIQKKAHHCFRK